MSACYKRRRACSTGGGVLVFSCNRLKFRLDTGLLDGLVVEDISKKTIPPDFERNPRIHQCWLITRGF